MTNPKLGEDERADLARRLGEARSAVRTAKQDADLEAEAGAHKAVDEIKRTLGERGPVWWEDGSPDLNRHMAKNTLTPNGMRRSGGLAPEESECPKLPSSIWTEPCWIPSICMRLPGMRRL
jgi:hypothetical protein